LCWTRQHVEEACLSSFFQWKLKFECSFQQREYRAIWHILALVNKFSFIPLHGKAINGKAQIFETLRLWRPLEPRENATSRVLFIHKIVAISVYLSVLLFFSNLWKMYVFLLKNRFVHYFNRIYLQNTVFCVFFAILGLLGPVFNWNALPLAGVAHSKNDFFSNSKRLNQILRGFPKNLSEF